MRTPILSAPSQATVSLTMIVRNEEPRLGRCLASVQGLFDEIVVVDTGSTDRTVDIATDFGARVASFPWIDDFAAARNASLEQASTDYVFWLDADDVVDANQRSRLKELIQTLPIAKKEAFSLKCFCEPANDGSSGAIMVDHIRLFPRDERLRWVYRVHEQILPSLLQYQVPVRMTDIVIRHTGYAEPGERERKRARDLRILNSELNARPNDAFVLFNVGSVHFERSEWQEALGCFAKSNASLIRSPATESLRRKLFGMLAWTHQIMGNLDDSIRVCDEGLTLDPRDAELWFRKAVAHRYRGETTTAEACWHRILGLPKPTQFTSIDQGIYGHLTRRNLALIASERGDQEEAMMLWQAILAECPGDPDAGRNLYTASAA